SACTPLPGCPPSLRPSGMSSTPRSWNPPTSASTDCWSPGRVILHSSPSAASTPAASMTSPTTRRTRPYTAKRGRSVNRFSSAGSPITQHPVGALEREVHTPVHDPVLSFHNAAAAFDLRVRDPPDVAARADRDRPAIRRGGRRQRGEVLRVHPDLERLLAREVRQRAPDDIRHELRLELHRFSHDVPRRRERERDEVVLDRRQPRRLRGPHRPRRLLARAHGGLEARGLRASALVPARLVTRRVALAVRRLERLCHLPRRLRGGRRLGFARGRFLGRGRRSRLLRLRLWLRLRLRRGRAARPMQLLRCPHHRAGTPPGHHGPLAHPMTISSLPELMTISPASSSARTTLTIAPCAASTSRSRTAPRNSISSLSAATARCDIVPRILPLTSSLAALSASASSFTSTSRRTRCSERSSSLARSSNTNIRFLISSASVWSR